MVLHVKTNVHVGLVEDSVVRVSLLAVVEGVVLLDEVGCAGVETVSEPERDKEVQETAETAELCDEDIGGDSEDDVVNLPGRRSLLHGSTADDVHDGVDEEPEQLQGSVTADHLLLPLEGQIGVHAGDTLVGVVLEMVATEGGIDGDRDTNVGGQSDELVEEDGGGSMVVGGLVDEDTVEGGDGSSNNVGKGDKAPEGLGPDTSKEVGKVDLGSSGSNGDKRGPGVVAVELFDIGVLLEDGELALHVGLVHVIHSEVIIDSGVGLFPVSKVEGEAVVEGLGVLWQLVLVLLPLVDGW